VPGAGSPFISRLLAKLDNPVLFSDEHQAGMVWIGPNRLFQQEDVA